MNVNCSLALHRSFLQLLLLYFSLLLLPMLYLSWFASSSRALSNTLRLWSLGVAPWTTSSSVSPDCPCLCFVWFDLHPIFPILISRSRWTLYTFHSCIHFRCSKPLLLFVAVLFFSVDCSSSLLSCGLGGGGVSQYNSFCPKRNELMMVNESEFHLMEEVIWSTNPPQPWPQSLLVISYQSRLSLDCFHVTLRTR